MKQFYKFTIHQIFIKFSQNTILVILLSKKDSNFKRIDREQGNLSGSIHYLSKVRNMEAAHKIMFRPGQLNNLIYDESKLVYHMMNRSVTFWFSITA